MVPAEGISIREVFANAVAEVLNDILWPQWNGERESLNLETFTPSGEKKQKISEMGLSESAVVRTAEEFVCFHYIAFIQNILARIRTMILSMICLSLLSASRFHSILSFLVRRSRFG